MGGSRAARGLIGMRSRPPRRPRPRDGVPKRNVRSKAPAIRPARSAAALRDTGREATRYSFGGPNGSIRGFA